MESLPKLGTAIGEVLLPTIQLYQPLLSKQADAIRSTQRDSFSYGDHPRQQLDLYTPTHGGESRNLLIFLYGGGLVRGDKINPNFSDGLVYANLGHFFAERLGCKVVIPDYRLIGHGAKFPSGGEDLELVIDWIKEKIVHDAAKPLDLHIMGNSAGGVHLSTYLFASKFVTSRQNIVGPTAIDVRLKSVVFLAVPFHFDQATAARAEMLLAYYDDSVRHKCPLGLLKARKEDGSISELKGVSVMVATGSLDPEDEILAPKDDFVKEWRSAEGVADNLVELVIEGHNHISPVFAVGTAVEAEEHWGQEVVNFLKRVSLEKR